MYRLVPPQELSGVSCAVETDNSPNNSAAVEIMVPQNILQPEMIGRQVKFAYATRDAGALLDAHQPVVLAQFLSDLA